jgi:hypothetical protein
MSSVTSAVLGWEMYASLLTERDLLLREQFEARQLPNEAFRHREHVRLTWIYLTLEDADHVEARLCRSLLELATSHGVGQRFHHTLTVAWVRIIESERRSNPDMPFDALVAACPTLLDKDAPLAYYSRERLYSDEARQRWIAPDLKPLPAV